jgi:hypothetical protein
METRTPGSYYPRAVSGPVDHVGARHKNIKVRPKVALGGDSHATFSDKKSIHFAENRENHCRMGRFPAIYDWPARVSFRYHLSISTDCKTPIYNPQIVAGSASEPPWHLEVICLVRYLPPPAHRSDSNVNQEKLRLAGLAGS